MKHTLLLITTICLIFSLALTGQQRTSDGGYIIAGTTQTYVHGGSASDFLAYKLSAAGAKEWRKNYGGDEDDQYTLIIQTSDGGYAVCGVTYSYTNGGADFLVYKLSASGTKLWRKNFGGTGKDYPVSIAQTSDGGFVVSGASDSYAVGEKDLLVYRLNAAGQKLWRKNYGGINTEEQGFIATTADGGFTLCGSSESYTNGGADFVVYKLNAAGQKEWRKNYGGLDDDYARVVRQTPDGGYIVAGDSRSYGPGTYGGAARTAFAQKNFLLYKLDASGAKQWRKYYGGEDADNCHDIRHTPDGGYIVLGVSRSYSYSGTDYDVLAYKVDAAGVKEWRKNYGGEGNDWAYKVVFPGDGGYGFFGFSDTYNQTGTDQDLLLYKVNSAGAKLWRKNYGGTSHEFTYGD